jgi:hypothetical protein
MHHIYHANPVVNDRLRTWFKLLWQQQVYEEHLSTAGIEHELLTRYLYLTDKVLIEETDLEWNYVVPCENYVVQNSPSLQEGATFLYMKPIEQLFDWAPTNIVIGFPKVTSGEILAHQTPLN